MSGYWRHLCLGIALVAVAPLLAADTDPPGRVGRISLANEGTHLRIGDAVAVGVTALNWPLTTGALIETASASRTEARIGSTALRIDGGSSLEFVELSDERIWLRLNRGSVVLRIQNPEHAAEMTLDTPQGRLRVDAPGRYRADVAGGTAAFSAYQGTAHIEDVGLTVRAGDRVFLLGGADRNYLLGQAERDAFSQWELAREQLVVRGETRYISPEMTGHEDLDRHGSWQETSEYGPAWFPQGMPLGWAPYRQGRWAWVSPWGWTWIDHAPWGFAPFHYGRWALIGNNWAWIPGAYMARPAYAPALIVWLGQPGWNASVSFGPAPAVGWFLLGPREIYYPHYRSSLRHVRNINVTHVTDVSRIVSVTLPQGHDRHIHRGRHEAMTVMPGKAVISEKTPSPPQRRVDHNRSIIDHPSRSLHRSQFAATPPLVRIAPTQAAAETVPPAARSTTPLSRSADSAPTNRPRGIPESSLPSSRRAEPKPMPSQAPAAVSFPVAQKPAAPVEAAPHRGPHSDRRLRDSEPLKPREAGFREQPRPKPGPQER